MSNPAEKVVMEALELPPALRAFVAEKLIESLDASDSTDISEAWREEIRRRCRDMDRDATELRTADEVFAKAHATLP